MNIQIELMKEEQLDDVANIFLSSFNDLGEGWTFETSRKNIEEGFFGDCHYVARIDGKIVGFILAIPLTRELGQELFVSSIAILPEFQNQGIGKQLWDKMESFGKENKFVAIRLLTNPHLKSFDWYKEMGFEESGWIEAFKKI